MDVMFIDVALVPRTLGLRNNRCIISVQIRQWRSYFNTQPIFVQDNKDLYAEEAAAQRERERQRMLSIPGLIAPNEIQDEMLDS